MIARASTQHQLARPVAAGVEPLFERITRLPKAQQCIVMRMFDTILQQQTSRERKPPPVRAGLRSNIRRNALRILTAYECALQPWRIRPSWRSREACRE